MNNKYNCNKNVFDCIKEEELKKLNYAYSKKNDVHVLQQTITKLSVQNQQLLEEVIDLKNEFDIKIDTINIIENATLELCKIIVDYVDIKKLRNDLKTKNFASKNVKDLLEHISDLGPCNCEVENEEN